MTPLPRLVLVGSCLAVIVSGGLRLPLGRASEPTVSFNRDVKPILAKNCFACHGPDGGQRKANLRLDQRASATKPRKKGPAIAPGKAAASRLLARVKSADDDERMPPSDAGQRLTPTQIAVLEKWIAQGAHYEAQWSFVKPVRPPLPKVKDTAWPKQDLDYFILARLERTGLHPSPPADKYALLRRVSLDLRGLPPTPQEIDEFIRDARPDAYERMVDRFLADPAYGERWARVWLDLARYADSAGYGSDPLRPMMWRWRDWVINAYNRNLPYDRFTVEQLAGDLLPHPTLEQRIATAFHRNTMTNTEGGTDDEEFRVAAVKDRVDTTFQVWMGLTVGCAKCHSHKFDPISQKEYYSLFAIFNQTADNDQPSETPTIPAPTPAQQKQLARIEARLAVLRQQLEQSSPQLAAEQAKWEAELRAVPTGSPLTIVSRRSEGGATILTARADGKPLVGFRVNSATAKSLRVTVGEEGKPPVGRFVRIELPGKKKMLSLAEVQVFRNGKNVAVTGTARQSSTAFAGEAKRAIDGNTNGDYFGANSTTHTNAETNPWWEVRLAEAGPVERIVVWNRTDGGLFVRLANFRVSLLDDKRQVVWTKTIAKAPNPSRELKPGGPRTIALADSFAVPGGRAWITDKPVSLPAGTPLMLRFDGDDQSARTGPVFTPSPLGREGRGGGKSPPAAQSAAPPPQPSPAAGGGRKTISAGLVFALTDRAILKRLSVPAAVRSALDTPAEKRTKEQREALAQQFRMVAPSLQPLRDTIAKLEKSKPKVVNLPVMEELPPSQHRKSHVLIKSNFLSPGAEVEPGLPAAFPPLPRGTRPDRLGLARWLISPDNPLTARVAANRYWAQLFGVGLVETEEDFGTQGEPPTHLQLLDWLATEYVRVGWDNKAFLKMLVTSATYRQSTRVTPELLAKDPRNKLLGRMPRVRLEAEMVRDQALALSGLLSRKVGGPSVYPPQPPGLWQAAFNGQRTWATSTGPDRYRRGLYTFWRRTVPYPSLATFDAPSRETCTVRRIRTNTPLQAFVTLNDPVYVEAAQALARRIVREGGQTPEERVRFALRLCLGRPAASGQVMPLVELYRSERVRLSKDAAAAKSLATDPLGPLPPGMDPAEAAAWTVVANVLLNLDGVLTKG